MSTQDVAPAPAAPRRRLLGCLTWTALAVVIVVAVVVGVVNALTVATRATEGNTTSGNAINARPAADRPPIATDTVPEAGTGGVTPLSQDTLVVSAVRNPDGPCSGTGPDLDLETMGLDGGDRRPIEAPPGQPAVNTDADEIWPRLSPDRRRLVFYRSPAGRHGELCRYPLQDLWLVNVDGTGLRQVFSNERKLEVARSQGWPADQAIQGHADWSPDGRHVVMVLGHAPNLGPLPLLLEGETQLFVLDVDTGDLRQVTDRVDAKGRGLSADPSWSPDGSELFFFGCPDATPSCNDSRILAVPADAERSRTARTVLDAPGRSGNDVYASPDGRSLAWMEQGLTGVRLYAAKLPAGEPIDPDDAVVVDPRGGYSNWSADSSALVYNRLWLGDRFAIYVNRFDGRPSQRITPQGYDEVFPFFST